jgi:hypothetical protein
MEELGKHGGGCKHGPARDGTQRVNMHRRTIQWLKLKLRDGMSVPSLDL